MTSTDSAHETDPSSECAVVRDAAAVAAEAHQLEAEARASAREAELAAQRLSEAGPEELVALACALSAQADALASGLDSEDPLHPTLLDVAERAREIAADLRAALDGTAAAPAPEKTEPKPSRSRKN